MCGLPRQPYTQLLEGAGLPTLLLESQKLAAAPVCRCWPLALLAVHLQPGWQQQQLEMLASRGCSHCLRLVLFQNATRHAPVLEQQGLHRCRVRPAACRQRLCR